MNAVAPDPLHRAKTYPYPIPDHSFLFTDGGATRLDPGRAVDLEGRTPVLAVGSNQAPEQLARKFDGPGWGEIPVIRIALAGYDSVYSPHIATYGAIAATLQEAPGVTVSLAVTWLTARQLVRMHETEVSSANYGFGRLDGLRVTAELGPEMDAVHIYTSTRGTLCHDGVPIPLAEVAAEGRTWPAMSQVEVQAHVHRRLEPDLDPDAFIHQSINDRDLRWQRSERLKAGARPFTPANFQAVPI